MVYVFNSLSDFCYFSDFSFHFQFFPVSSQFEVTQILNCCSKIHKSQFNPLAATNWFDLNTSHQLHFELVICANIMTYSHGYPYHSSPKKTRKFPPDTSGIHHYKNFLFFVAFSKGVKIVLFHHTLWYDSRVAVMGGPLGLYTLVKTNGPQKFNRWALVIDCKLTTTKMYIFW